MPKYGVFCDPYFPVFGLNKGKYGQGKTPYLDTFHAVDISSLILLYCIVFIKCQLKKVTHHD